MNYTTKDRREEILLKRCDLLEMTDDGYHGITARKQDNGIDRNIRYSITFRKTKNE